MAKRSMAWLLPRYNAVRMLNEYVSRFYLPASRQGRRYAGGDLEGARVVAEWKARIRAAWPAVAVRRIDSPHARIRFGESLPVEVAVKLGGLSPDDVTVEMLLQRGIRDLSDRQRVEFVSAGEIADSGEHRFTLDLKPEFCGTLEYRIRVYPRHALLTHPFEMGLMLWV